MTTEVEWRRRWKPDLRACPWRSIQIGPDNYLVKAKFSENSYEILLTDLTLFWYEELAGNALQKRIKTAKGAKALVIDYFRKIKIRSVGKKVARYYLKLNPSIEASVTKILDQIRQNLESPVKGTRLSIVFRGRGEDTESMVLKINSQLAGMPFTWHFDGTPADQSLASDHLIVPLIAMVGELTRRQQELINIIQNKDKEIDDYKSQGVKTTRKHLTTLPFEEKVFSNDMAVSKGFEDQVKRLGITSFDQNSEELYRQIMLKHAWLKRSPTKERLDDSLMDDESLAAIPKANAPSWGTNRIPPSFGQSKSPNKTPEKSPIKTSQKRPASTSPIASPPKDPELLRRQALEKKLETEEVKKQDKMKKKKKKLAF